MFGGTVRLQGTCSLTVLLMTSERRKTMSDYLLRDYNDTLSYVERVYRGMEAFHPVIITCAITGGFQGKETNPNLPETIDEQVQSAVDAYNAGAAMVHIHARDPERPGDMSSDPEIYREINQRIREKCPDLIINNTAMGGHKIGKDGRMSNLLLTSLYANPEVASIDLMLDYQRVKHKKRPAPLTGRDEDEMLQHFYVIQNEDALEVMHEFIKRGIMPEYELFDMTGIKMLRRLIATCPEEIHRPYWVSLLFGGNGMMPSVTSIIEAASLLPKDAMVNIIGIGPAQIPMIAAGMLLGHNVRVGMEDNAYYSRGRLLKSNAEMVERVVRLAGDLGRSVASPAQARQMMGLGEPRTEF